MVPVKSTKMPKNVNLQSQTFVVTSCSLSQEKRWLRYLKIEELAFGHWLLALGAKEAAWHWVAL
jgi:hypothetical protein